MSRPRNLLFLVLLVFGTGGVSAFGSAANAYVTSTGGAVGNCPSGSTTFTPAQFNNSSNWGSGAAQIGAGTTVLLCGTINGPAGATVLTFQGGGTSGNPITLRFDTGAVIAAPYLSVNGGIVASGRSWIVIDGGTNGTIENTLDGSSGSTCPGGTCTQQQNSAMVNLSDCTNCTVQNLNMPSIYVRASGDGNGYGVGINVRNQGLSGATNVLINNNTIQDSSSGVFYFFGTNESGIEVKNNTISRTNWGVAFGAAVSGNTITGVTVHDNNIFDHGNWDDFPTPYSNHHNGVFIFGGQTGNAISGCYVYNNYFYGSFGSGTSPGLYLDNVSTGTFTCTAFNNVIAPASTGPGGNGGLTAQNESGSGAVHLTAYNNTIICNPLSSGPAGIWIQGSNMVTVLENNIIGGWSTDLTLQGSAALPTTSNYNDWYPVTSTSLFDRYSTVTAWQAATGLDASSISSAPNLSSNFVPNSGSPVIARGTNLFSLCNGQPNPGLGALCFDKAGNRRPASGAWDVGAFQFGSTITTAPNPPTGLTAVVH